LVFLDVWLLFSALIPDDGVVASGKTLTLQGLTEVMSSEHTFNDSSLLFLFFKYKDGDVRVNVGGEILEVFLGPPPPHNAGKSLWVFVCFVFTVGAQGVLQRLLVPFYTQGNQDEVR
jgi:hypothetical protein